MLKQTVFVLYGGESTEHEVSCRSAASIVKNLDRKKYNIKAIGISKGGQWLPHKNDLPLPEQIGEILQLPELLASSSASDFAGLMSANRETDSRQLPPVVFSVVHGYGGEDGRFQGLFDLIKLPYVGPDCLGSAVAMDKAVAKTLVKAAGVPVADFFTIRAQEWFQPERSQIEGLVRKRAFDLEYPLFIKPTNGGSSVGVSKARNETELFEKIKFAFEFDEKIIIEKGLDAREIECAALGDYNPVISIPGEVIPHSDFYTYEAKYSKNSTAEVKVPAELTDAQITEVQKLSLISFQALELYGMARLDFFLEKSSGKFYFNEANTIPGFTSISQYPMLWKQSGISQSELLDRLIESAIQRYNIRSKQKRVI
ncbi:MAG: D-alanine--D-alanine ligase [Oligoflexales bacterium]|nr:D-alanine--D-alanine ligase [Oligoflexales bacterium]